MTAPLDDAGNVDYDARLIFWNDAVTALILQGHGHGVEAMQALGQRDLGEPVTIEEHWLDWAPRIKWCGRRDWACDNEGEWHGHWFASKPRPGAEWTVLIPSSNIPPTSTQDGGQQ